MASSSSSSSSSLLRTRRPIALVMGVANARSIAWSCVEAFISKKYDCIVTYDGSTTIEKTKIQKLIDHLHVQQHSNNGTSNSNDQNNCNIATNGRVLGCIPCNVITDIPSLFQERIPELLQHNCNNSSNNNNRKLDAIVHSIAYADMTNHQSKHYSIISTTKGSSSSSNLLLSNATWDAYATSQHISSYSLVESARHSIDMLSDSSASITALTYLGSQRAVPNYHLMGPAKAALEAIVRGLAVDLGCITIRGENNNNNNNNSTVPDGNNNDDISDANNTITKCIRVNAISAGPIRTAAARGIPNFGQLYSHVAINAPIKRNVTAAEVAEAVTWVSSPAASGITGQIIYVDGGYSSIVPCY